MSKLKVGDQVLWRGDFGSAPAKIAVVEDIEKCPKGSKYGKPVKSIDWDKVDRSVVVSLDNGHWAYGTQISKK